METNLETALKISKVLIVASGIAAFGVGYVGYELYKEVGKLADIRSEMREIPQNSCLRHVINNHSFERLNSVEDCEYKAPFTIQVKKDTGCVRVQFPEYESTVCPEGTHQIMKNYRRRGQR